MEIPGLNKIGEAIGNAFSVFDFSFFVSGTVTLSFIVLDMHYYGYNGILYLEGWKAVAIYILAIYVCGLMSWSVGKLMRWAILWLIWWKKRGINGDFKTQFEKIESCYIVNPTETGNKTNDVKYSEMWIEIEKEDNLARKLNSLNKMWVMVALYEGLAFSWIVGLLVYFDGWLVGKWIKTSCLFWNIVPCFVLLGLSAASLHRATRYSCDLIKDVITTYYNK